MRPDVRLNDSNLNYPFFLVIVVACFLPIDSPFMMNFATGICLPLYKRVFSIHSGPFICETQLVRRDLMHLFCIIGAISWCFAGRIIANIGKNVLAFKRMPY